MIVNDPNETRAGDEQDDDGVGDADVGKPRPGGGSASRPHGSRNAAASVFGPRYMAGFSQSLFADVARISGRQSALFRSLNPAAKFFEQLAAERRSFLRSVSIPNSILVEFRRSIALYTGAFADLPRRLLPPNLQEASDQISPTDVYNFLETEGIPLYLVPRVAIGKRLLLAEDHSSRRRVLSDRFGQIVDDCAVLLDGCDHPAVSTEVHYTKDGIGALRAGHYASAQAIFTVTLDTLIYRFFPDREKRGKITNRQKGAAVPDEIKEMRFRDAFVWLPIWNAHQQYWKHKNDRIPNDYSRHATVHGVSKTQFNKRNCVQSLMLVSSLIGYADRLVRARDRSRN